MRPFFSIVVVCLNPGERLGQTLESIRIQSCRDYEILIKDGLSTDGSIEKIEINKFEINKFEISKFEINKFEINKSETQTSEAEKTGSDKIKEEKIETEKRKTEKSKTEKSEIKDAEIEKRDGEERIRIVRQKDSGIYDAMNQALEQVRGRYVYFLNCGDIFHDPEVLAVVKQRIQETERIQEAEQIQEAEGLRETERIQEWKQCRESEYVQGSEPGADAGQVRQSEQSRREADSRFIFYGDIVERLTGQRVSSNPSMDAFGCYRNVPCHQACFYGSGLMKERGFLLQYRVRADYEHFLWCFFRGRAVTVYLPVTVAVYEGGGFSETAENRRRSAKEHKEITGTYLTPWQVRKYRLLLLFSLAPLRTWLSANPLTAGWYQKGKALLYRWRSGGR